MAITSTVVGGWAVAVSRALDAMGFNGDDLLRQSNIDLTQKFVQDARFSSEQTRRFWSLAVQKTGFDDIGLRVANFVCPTTFHALGFSLWASATLLDALSRMSRFDVLLNDGCALSVEELDDAVCLHMSVRTNEHGPLVSPEGIDYFLGAVVKLFRDMKRPDISPTTVKLQRVEPPGKARWGEHFGCSPLFGSETNTLVFSRHELTELLPTGNPDLARQNDQAVVEYLNTHRYQNLASQVEASLNNLLPCHTCTIEDVAAALETTPRTLRYRLKQENTTFKDILETTRKRLALRYLDYSRKSISEISYSLGFSEPSHFNRAFKRWTQFTPSQYRDRHAIKDNRVLGSS